MVSPISWNSATRRERSAYGFSGRGFFVPKAECLALPLCGAWHRALLDSMAAYFRALGKEAQRHG